MFLKKLSPISKCIIFINNKCIVILKKYRFISKKKKKSHKIGGVYYCHDIRDIFTRL